MTILRIPTPLRPYTNGKNEVNVSGANVADALNDLTSQFPSIKPHLFNEGNELRPFVNLFIGEHNIKDLQGIDTPIKDGDRLMLIPSIAGGSLIPNPSPMGRRESSPLSLWERIRVRAK